MTSKRVLAEDIIYDLVHFAFFYGFFTLVSNMLALFMFIPFFCNFIFRHYIKNTFLMTVAHLIIVGVVFLVSYNYWVLIFLAVMLVYSFYRRAKGQQSLERITAVFMSTTFIAIYFASEHVGLYQHPLTYPLLIIIVMIGTELRSRMIKVDASLEMTAKTSVQPIKQILRFDRKLMPILIIILLTISLATHLAIEPQLSRISFSGIERDSGLPDPQAEALMPPSGASQGDMDLSAFGEAREASIFWTMLELVVLFILRVAMVIVPMLLLISGALALYKMLAYNKKTPSYEESGDEKIFLIPERMKHRITNPLSYFRWNENKIRRTFRKKMQQHIKAGVPIVFSDTPAEMTGRIVDEDLGELLEEYRQVRYGED